MHEAHNTVQGDADLLIVVPSQLHIRQNDSEDRHWLVTAACNGLECYYKFATFEMMQHKTLNT